ncbi:hypothetical protein [Photobacterium phosphoreum]|uniref:hypothetical protein n=1 Tax=Photobacterium phosphoreum TaxID=659 RepID=UPI000D16F1E7|nr:hypothetical protein [Photobacterium phosphoreum]PTB30964.1 hypothetical protein DAT36_19470 [Photobacterium phosphoreum]
MNKRKDVSNFKKWNVATLVVVERYRTNNEYLFYEKEIERWQIPEKAKRVYGFELSHRDNETYHDRIRELLNQDRVVLVEVI